MKNILITIILLFSFLTYNHAQNIIENVTWKFTNKKMVISFDLNSPDNITDRRYDLGIEVILESGSFKPSTGLSGHISQLAGKKRQIVWYYTSDGRSQRELDIPETDVKIFIKKTTPKISKNATPLATESTPTTIIKTSSQPSLTLPSVVTVAGTSAIIYGFILEKKGKKLYDEYKLDTSNSRDDIYDKANKKHVPAQYLTYGGGLLAITGIYLITRTLKKRKAIKNDNLSIIPATNDGLYLGSNLGMGIQYSF